MKRIFLTKQIARRSVTSSITTMLTMAAFIVLGSGRLAMAKPSDFSVAGLDCATATAELSSAQTTYLNAQRQLNQAQQKCNGDFNCIYPYQSAFAQAQANLLAAQNAVGLACK